VVTYIDLVKERRKVEWEEENHYLQTLVCYGSLRTFYFCPLVPGTKMIVKLLLLVLCINRMVISSRLINL